MNTTHKTPSHEAVKVAEEILSLVIGSKRKGNGLPDLYVVAPIIDRHFAGLREASEKVLEGFDKGFFVRSVANDDQPDWAIKLLPYVQSLIQLRATLSAVEKGKVGE